MGEDFNIEVSVDVEHWPTNEDWALREKYFLYLRDHALRHRWRAEDGCYCLYVDDLLDHDLLAEKLRPFGICDEFHRDWERWFAANRRYLDPVIIADDTLRCLDQNIPLPKVDIWTQAVINYYVWLDHGVEIPANDCKNWFTNSQQIVKIVDNQAKA